MDKVFIFLGMLTLAWPLLGVVLLAFFANVYVVPGAPWHAKVKAVFLNSFVYPYFLLFHWTVPAVVIQPVNMTKEEEDGIKRWMQSWCQCAGCKRRRGE